jgi:hypothetical protein
LVRVGIAFTSAVGADTRWQQDRTRNGAGGEAKSEIKIKVGRQQARVKEAAEEKHESATLQRRKAVGRMMQASAVGSL